MIYNSIRKQIRSTFEGMVFNQEAHTYTINGKRYISVSKLIENFYKPFKSKKVAGYTSQARGIPIKDLLKEWDDIRIKACDFGTRVHDFGERYATDKFNLTSKITFYSVYQHLVNGEELSPQEKALVKFWDDMPDFYIPLVLEEKMFSTQWRFAGTADIILLDIRDMTLAIGDYKTNKDLFKQYKNQKMLGLFSHLDDTPLGHYQIQLSLYDILLSHTNYKVSRRFVVWLKADGTYHIYNMTDYTERLIEFLHKRKIDESW